MERMEDAEIWDTTVFSKDRDRLLKGDTARAFFRKTRHRRLAPVGWMFTFGVAVYNLVRMRNPMEVRA